MVELRELGFCYWKIADIFNSIDVLIKMRGVKQHSIKVKYVNKSFVRFQTSSALKIQFKITSKMSRQCSCFGVRDDDEVIAFVSLKLHEGLSPEHDL